IECPTFDCNRVWPEKNPRHSAKVFANVTIAWRSSTPRVTNETRSLPAELAIANRLSLPFVALMLAAMSSHVLGVPSLHTALGLMVYVTTWGLVLVSLTSVK